MSNDEIVSTADVIRLIATLDWEEFDEADYESFGGVASEKPMIAYTNDATYILDGNCFAVYGTWDDEGQVYGYTKAYFLEAKTYN